MKIIYLFMAFAFVSLSLGAQGYSNCPILETGKVWNYTVTVKYMLDEEDYEIYGTDKFARHFSVSVNEKDVEYGCHVTTRLCVSYCNDGFDERLSIGDHYYHLVESENTFLLFSLKLLHIY